MKLIRGWQYDTDSGQYTAVVETSPGDIMGYMVLRLRLADLGMEPLPDPIAMAERIYRQNYWWRDFWDDTIHTKCAVELRNWAGQVVVVEVFLAVTGLGEIPVVQVGAVLIHAGELAYIGLAKCAPEVVEILRNRGIINPPRRDPLVLDLNGDGFQTVPGGVATFFDWNADGFHEKTGWVDGQDGLLVMDRNGNGIIDDGKELFGDQTILWSGKRATNAFQALAELDTNRDGKIDAVDAAFQQLKVLKSSDDQGNPSPTGLLYTLDQLGIKSISLNSTATNITDAQGNTQTRLGSFEKLDGTTGQIAEYGLQRDTMRTIAEDWRSLPDDIAALPYLEGYGNIYDLRQAMVRDASGQLRSLVEQFAATSDISGRDALMQQILFKWTGTDSQAVPRSARDHRRLRKEREEQLFELFSAPFAISAANSFALVA